MYHLIHCSCSLLVWSAVSFFVQESKKYERYHYSGVLQFACCKFFSVRLFMGRKEWAV